MSADVPSFPFEHPNALAPAPELTRLAAAAPVSIVRMPDGATGYLVTSYTAAQAMLADPRFSRAALGRPAITATAGAHEAPRWPTTARFSRAAKSTCPAALPEAPPRLPGLLELDPPEHTAVRGLLSRAFSARRIDRIRFRLETIADTLAKRLASSAAPADLQQLFMRPFPIAAISAILGIPDEDDHRFGEWVRPLWSLTALTPEDIRYADACLRAYLHDLITRRRDRLDHGLLLDLLSQREQQADLSEARIGSLAAMLLVTGSEPTSITMGASVIRLVTHEPEWWAQLCAEPERISVLLADELFRLHPPADAEVFRATTEDVVLAGVPIPAGSLVIASMGAADSTPTAFPQPERLAPGERPAHLAFGHGVHYCLGSSLAKLQLRITLATMARHFPGLRLAVPEEELRWRTGYLMGGAESLPVTW